MDVSNKTLALVAVAGLALAGYAGAASIGMVPEGMDAGLGNEARQERLAKAQERCQLAIDEGNDVPAICERILAGELPGRIRGGDRDGAPDGDRKGHARHHAKHVARALGPFEQSDDGAVTGKWVSFQVDAEHGMLLDYTSHGPFADAVLYDSISLAPVTGEQASRMRGPLWVGKDGDVGAAAFNAPHALFAARNTGAEATTIAFDVGEGIAAELTDEGVLLSKDGKQAWIRVRGDTASLAVDGDVVTATLGEGDAVVSAIEGYPGLMKFSHRILAHLGDRADDRPPAGEGARAPEEPSGESDGA